MIHAPLRTFQFDAELEYVCHAVRIVNYFSKKFKQFNVLFTAERPHQKVMRAFCREEYIKLLELFRKVVYDSNCVTHVFQFGIELKGSQRRMNHDARGVT